MADYTGFKDHCYSRRQWIFSLLIILFVADIADTLLKGNAYWPSLGAVYYPRAVLYISLSAAAIKIKDERFHAGFAIFATLSEIALILKYYMAID
jgi:hypothetical protein